MISISISRNSLLAAAIAAVAGFAGHTAMAAPQTINLTAVDGYPPRALQVRTFINYFIPEVNKRLAASGKY